MLRTDINWPDHRQYLSRSEYEPFEFFSNGLCNSTRFDLFLGFFSSSAIRLLSDCFAIFLHRGGKMRLIINNILSNEDKEAIKNGQNNIINNIFDINDINTLRTTLSKKDRHFFDCLAWMITNKRIEIKIVKPKNSIGISHLKQGVFSDEENSISFSGSCNFSKNAILENLEGIDVNCDWDGMVAQCKINKTIELFETTFNEKNTNVSYLSANDIISDIKQVFGNKELITLLQEENDLIEDNLSEQDFSSNPRIQNLLQDIKDQVDKMIVSEYHSQTTPHFPFIEGPRDYQQFAFERWNKNKQQGLFAMATGTGKTITSLNCLLRIYNAYGYYKAIILVPTITLVEQWEKECLNFNFKNIYKVCSKYQWKNEVAEIATYERFDKKQSYIIISTYASFIRQSVYSSIFTLSSKCLIIADEAHNLGAPKMLALLPKIPFKRRIGLSATPTRQYDQEANRKIAEFFNNEEEFSFIFSMEEAINKNILCHYYYYPHLVSLNAKEMNQYAEISKKILKYYNPDTDSFKDDPILTALLLKRKRIIHKAHNKLQEFKNILSTEYQSKGALKYTMIYVPEGKCPSDEYEDYSYEIIDEKIEDIDELDLINSYTAAVRDETGATVAQFTSNSSNRDQLLEDFKKGDIEVLTSMKCLDEGIDVPQAKLAIFCASTGNPRQFIQRRGRILRKHKDKSHAYIHDLVVIPNIDSADDTYTMERNMLKKELERVKDFSLLADNSSYTIDILEDVLDQYELNLYNNK